jgi:excinuclease ABC subunit C
MINFQISDHLAKTLKNLPESAGVYRYYDVAGNILYIGKAVNLKKRVSSYFQGSKIKTERMLLLINQIDKIEYSVVKNEKEALILEANLIHSLQPKFNILLKNEASYVYVCRSRDPIPSFFTTRKKYDPKARYFGPYTKKVAISDILRTLRLIFPYCQAKTPSSKPCPYVALKQCNGICYGKESFDEYISRLSLIEKILSGKTSEVQKLLIEKMNEAIKKYDFELASIWRDKIRLLDETISDQKIILPQPQDVNILNLVLSIQDDGLLIGSVYLQEIKEGKIINVNNYLLTGSELDSQNQEIIISFIKKEIEYYQIENILKDISKSFLLRFFGNILDLNNPYLINISLFLG